MKQRQHFSYSLITVKTDRKKNGVSIVLTRYIHQTIHSRQQDQALQLEDAAKLQKNQLTVSIHLILSGLAIEIYFTNNQKNM